MARAPHGRALQRFQVRAGGYNRAVSKTGINDDRGATALLVIDMLNPYEHDDAEELAASVADAVPAVSDLVQRARDSETSVIYVNDNYGDWNSSAGQLAQRALEGRHPELVEPVLPPQGSSFVIKPRHSAFYQTPLEYLLYRRGVERVVLTGQVTEQCILYSALDAYVRHLSIVVPRDAVAHIDERLAQASLDMMQRNMRVEVPNALDFSLGVRVSSR
jgi:nicotinamidase-related amidase